MSVLLYRIKTFNRFVTNNRCTSTSVVRDFAKAMKVDFSRFHVTESVHHPPALLNRKLKKNPKEIPSPIRSTLLKVWTLLGSAAPGASTSIVIMNPFIIPVASSIEREQIRYMFIWIRPH
jgi:hypothetical protein